MIHQHIRASCGEALILRHIAFQDAIVGAVMLIVQAQNGDITADEIKEYMSTADCLEILSAQSEVQGLLGCFRSILGGLHPLEGRTPIHQV